MVNMESFCLRVLLLTTLVLVFASAVLAQSTATLQGTVTDQKGAVVPNATLIIRNQATSIERTVQTDASGNYQAAALPAGVYAVEVQAQGFKSSSVSDLHVEVARTVVENFQLEIGSLEQKVNVTADASVIESTTTSVGQVIN